MCFALIITISNNPYNITSMSVLLSYGGVIGIVFFSKSVQDVLDKTPIPKYIKGILAVSIAVQIVIMPIMIYSFKTMQVTFIISTVITSGLIGIIILMRFCYSFCFIIYTNKFN